MAIDPSISLNAKAPDSSNLSSLLDLSAKSLALKKTRATIDSDIAQRKAESQNAITQADIQQQTAPAQIQEMQTNAQKALLGLNDAQRESVGTFVSSLAGSDPKTVKTKLEALGEFQPQLKPAIDYMWKAHLEPTANNAKSFNDTIRHVGLSTMTVPEQFQNRTASGPMVSNNQQSAIINQNPGADIPVGDVAPGTAVQMQRSPDASTFVNNAPAAVGVQPNQTPGPVQTGPALGQVSNTEGTVAPVNEDYANTIKDASTASRDIGVFQNIKKYAKGAFTGALGDKKSYTESIAAAFGLPVDQIGKTDTDLLMKNANMASLGGNTDAARALLESANPNVHMSPEAIQKAADQVIAQRRLALIKQQYMGQFKSDPATYAQKLSDFNSVADPRILQLRSMSLEDKSKMKSAMSPQERQEFSAKIKKAHDLGIFNE